MKRLANQGRPGVQYAKVDLQRTPQLGQKYGVRSIPDTRIFHDGKEIGQFTGSCDTATLEEIVGRHLSSVRPVEEMVAKGAAGVPAEPAIQRESSRSELPLGIQRLP